MERTAVLKVDNINKSYGKYQVLKDVSFTVYENEIIGLVGHNGAGKTTLIESIIGLRKGYSGDIEIFGKTMLENSKGLKKKIGVQLQDSAINGMMRVFECIEFQAAAFGVEVDVDQLLERFDLKDHRKKHFSKLSGGLQQRLFVLLSIVHNPSLVFYDELTTGLDQAARSGIYKYILTFASPNKAEKIIEYFKEIEDIPQITKEDASASNYIMKISNFSLQDVVRKKMESNPDMFLSLNIRQATMCDVYDEYYRNEGESEC